VLVAAAGNTGNTSPQYPAGYEKVIAVAGTDQNDRKVNGSTYGNFIDVCAPGKDLRSTATGSPNNNAYLTKTGTSFACPLTAGLCGLMLSLNPNLSQQDLITCLKSSAKQIDNLNPGMAGKLGSGRIDAGAALQCVAATLSATDIGISQIVAPNRKTICSSTTPLIVKLYNYGTNIISKATIKYRLSNGQEKTHDWEGNLGPGENTEIEIGTLNLTEGPNTVEAYTVVAGGNDGNASNDKSSFSFVSQVNARKLPFTESFEGTFPPAGWTVINQDTAMSWEKTAQASSHGSSSAYINNWNYEGSGSKDELLLPGIDLTGHSSATMEFHVAYTNFTPPDSGYSEQLEVLVSTDCGITFERVYYKKSPQLNTAPYTEEDFIPLDNQWRKESISLDDYIGQGNVTIKIRHINDYENNMYIDDLLISANPSSLSPAAIEDAISSYPNPTNGLLNVNWPATGKLEFRIYNSSGALVLNESAISGASSHQLDLLHLAEGLYHLQVSSEETTFESTKVVIKR